MTLQTYHFTGLPLTPSVDFNGCRSQKRIILSRKLSYFFANRSLFDFFSVSLFNSSRTKYKDLAYLPNLLRINFRTPILILLPCKRVSIVIGVILLILSVHISLTTAGNKPTASGIAWLYLRHRSWQLPKLVKSNVVISHYPDTNN